VGSVSFIAGSPRVQFSSLRHWRNVYRKEGREEEREEGRERERKREREGGDY
jgi:hypothetical protein